MTDVPVRNRRQLGSRLQHLRLKAPLSIRQLADSAGVSQTTIRQIEKGKRRPRLITVAKLAAVLRIDPADFDDDFWHVGDEQDRRFRGGKQSKRDREFTPFKDRNFRRWWHRKGKKLNNGDDIKSEEDAVEWCKYWTSNGSELPNLLQLPLR